MKFKDLNSKEQRDVVGVLVLQLATLAGINTSEQEVRAALLKINADVRMNPDTGKHTLHPDYFSRFMQDGLGLSK